MPPSSQPGRAGPSNLGDGIAGWRAGRFKLHPVYRIDLGASPPWAFVRTVPRFGLTAWRGATVQCKRSTGCPSTSPSESS